MSERYSSGELFVYTNGDRWELGMVKRPNNSGDGYFCWYSRGDTAANTPTSCMHKLSNAGFTHIEQQLDAATESERTAIRKVTSYGAIGRCNCSACNWCVDPIDAYCRRCGASFTRTEYTYCQEEAE